MMRALKVGMSGPDVYAWQAFLKDAQGTSFYRGSVTGDYDHETEQATTDFQRFHELDKKNFGRHVGVQRGVADNATVGQAMLLGYPVISDDTIMAHLREVTP